MTLLAHFLLSLIRYFHPHLQGRFRAQMPKQGEQINRFPKRAYISRQTLESLLKCFQNAACDATAFLIEGTIVLVQLPVRGQASAASTKASQ